MTRRLRTVVPTLIPMIVAMALPAPASAQEGGGVVLSLEEAIGRATGESEEIRLARARVELAGAQVTVTRSQALPQISGNLGYTRTFESAFGGGGEAGFQLPDSLSFNPDPDAPLAERVRYLEQNAPLAALGALGGLFTDLPFGQDHVYQATLSGSQLLYSGGRISSALAVADRFRRSARLNLREEVAEIELQVRTAYFQALLARELAASAEQALAQADEFLEEERLRRDAGTASDLDVLRAEVSRDNLRPQLVQARNAAELALLNLKRLVDIPLGAPIELSTPLLAPSAAEVEEGRLAPEVLTAQRAAIQAAQEQVGIRQEQVDIARSSFLPDVRLNMSYGKQLLPSDMFDFSGDWRTDWTAGLSVSVPIFNGGRNWAELQVARVELDQAQIQLAQLEESVQLQYEQALGERERALEAIAARRTTVEAAQRVHDLTVLRYEQGQATQLEVSQARLELLNARTNLAQAITDYHIADAGLYRAVAGGDGATQQGNTEQTARSGNRR